MRCEACHGVGFWPTHTAVNEDQEYVVVYEVCLSATATALRIAATRLDQTSRTCTATLTSVTDRLTALAERAFIRSLLVGGISLMAFGLLVGWFFT